MTLTAAREVRRVEIRRVLVITFLANVLVLVAKAVAGFHAHSLSVIADAAHSSVDAWNNVMALLVARVAMKAPDAEHPYGHAKFETLGALGIVAFLSITVFQLLEGAVIRLLGRGPETHVTTGLVVVMLGSAFINFMVARYEERYGHRFHSDILLADAAHTRSDIYASLAVLIGIAFTALGIAYADAIATIIVAAVISRAGWRIIQRTVPILVDQRAVEEEAIRHITLNTDGVVDCFHVRSRGRIGEIFAELTITVAPRLNVHEAHVIADSVEQRVASAVGAREVVVHVEPANAE